MVIYFQFRFLGKNLAAGTAVRSFYTATSMLTTHQVLSFPQASKLSSSASLVKFSSSVCSMASFLWPHFLHSFSYAPIFKKCRKWGHKNEAILTPISTLRSLNTAWVIGQLMSLNSAWHSAHFIAWITLHSPGPITWPRSLDKKLSLKLAKRLPSF